MQRHYLVQQLEILGFDENRLISTLQQLAIDENAQTFSQQQVDAVWDKLTPEMNVAVNEDGINAIKDAITLQFAQLETLETAADELEARSETAVMRVMTALPNGLNRGFKRVQTINTTAIDLNVAIPGVASKTLAEAKKEKSKK